MSAKKSTLTRREMLKLSAGVAAGALLAGCSTPTKAPEVQPTAMPEKKIEGNVVVMHFRHEFTEDQEKAFEDANPGITMEFVDGTDLTRYFAMYAAGTPPDLVRIQAPSIPGMLARKLLLDLTPYFQTSTLLKMDDLMPANDYYKAESPLKVGKGKIYGMVKDFSPDFTIYTYDKLFEDAGVTPPDDTKSLSYAEVMELSKKVAKFEGDRTLVFGYGYEGGWIDRIWMNMLAEKSMNLYAEGFNKIVITGNEDTKAAAKWFYDMAEQKLTPSPLNPSPAGWFGNDFTAGQLAMCQYGFWYSAMAESDINRGKIRMLPGPNWAGAARDVTMTATGMVASSASQLPDATWKVFEFYNGGQPSIDRAKSGWGVPGLKSQLELIPQTTDFQKQANKVLQAELAQTAAPLQFNPFIGESNVSASWSKNLDIALRGEITFDTLLANIEAEVNQAIQDGITAILG